MSPEAQRIAIAEACGYEIRKVGNGKGAMAEFWGPQTRYIAKCVYSAMDWGAGKYLPDYLNDLNAMRSAEEHLKDKIDEGVYEERIEMEMGTRGRAAFSTAKQRASAMVKTLNLWKE